MNNILAHTVSGGVNVVLIITYINGTLHRAPTLNWVIVGSYSVLVGSIRGLEGPGSPPPGKSVEFSLLWGAFSCIFNVYWQILVNRSKAGPMAASRSARQPSKAFFSCRRQTIIFFLNICTTNIFSTVAY